MKTDCDRIRELLEAYAVGSLEPDEQALVNEHVVECTECRRLLNEYQELVATLPEMVADVSPLHVPASIKQGLLQKLDDSPHTTPEVTDFDQGLMGTPQLPADSRSRQSWTQPKLPPKQPIRRTHWVRLAALAVGMFLILLIIWSLQLQAALARERALRAEFASLVDQQEVVLEVVDSDKTIRRVLLAPEPRTDSSLPAYGKLFTRPDLAHVVAMVARLPQPEEGEGYHLWLTDKGQIKLAGIMKINDDGFALLVFDADQNGPIYDTAKLTLQPLEIESPTDEIILQWENTP